MPRYSREDALNQRELVHLLEGARKLKTEQAFLARFVIMCSAKMGMRGGEICHISSDWINTSDNIIEIPQHDECNKGKREDEVCGYCRNNALKHMRTHNKTVEEEVDKIREEFGGAVDETKARETAKERVEEHNITKEEAVSKWWSPKTSQASRSIPYDFDVRLQIVIERFKDEYSIFPKSKSTINRLVNKAHEQSKIKRRIYPHCLRATAATTMASRNISPHALMAIMGWSDLDTARTYISASEESAAKEIRSKYR